MKSIEIYYSLAIQIHEGDELIKELRVLVEKAEETITKNRVAYDITNNLGERLRQETEYEEAKKFFTQAYEGRRELLGEEAKDTLGLLMNLGLICHNMGDYQASLDCKKQCLKA